jgi:hypothetical protein
MNATQLGEALAKVLPAIRTKLQLAGLAVIVVAWLLVHFAQPGRTDAMLTGGAIGVSMIIFGQLFHFLQDFPDNSRAGVFLGAFGMFCLLVVALLLATVILLRQPSMDVTLEGEAQSDRQRFDIMSPAANSRPLWRIASTEPVLPKVFQSDQNDDYLRREAEKYGSGVSYVMTERDGVSEVTASMPYLRKMRGEGFIVPMTVDRFRWVPPVLSFKVSNPRFQPLFITRATIGAVSAANEDEPILIVSDAKPYRKLGSTDNAALYYPLSFYNVSWGIVKNPVLRFSIVRNADIEDAARGSFRYSVAMNAFDEQLKLDLTNYIDKNMARESEVLSRPTAVNYEYLNVIGQIAFETERGESRLANFRARVYFNSFGPGRVNPSYKYNVYLPDDVRDFPITIPLSQCVARRSADNFLMAFNSRRSTRYDLTIDVRSTDDVVLTKRVVLHTMVSRNYGLATPTQIYSFFDTALQGCT